MTDDASTPKIATPWNPDLDRAAARPPASRARHRAGIVLSGLATLFLVFDVVIKLVKTAEVDAAMRELGWPTDQARPLGATLAACLALYVFPRTSALGAVLLTGYLGGAVATHLRVGNPLASHTFFPLYVAAFLWAGLALRDDRVRALLPRI